MGHWLEVDSKIIKREAVERLVEELMNTEQGREKWKKLADEATGPDGSSFTNLGKIINEILIRERLISMGLLKFQQLTSIVYFNLKLSPQMVLIFLHQYLAPLVYLYNHLPLSLFKQIGWRLSSQAD